MAKVSSETRIWRALVSMRFSPADLLGVVTGHHQREVAVGKLEHEVFAVLAEHIALLPALDDCCAVMGIHDFVSDVERHTSPMDETAGEHSQSARKRLLEQL